jgi:hypothetical protein
MAMIVVGHNVAFTRQAAQFRMALHDEESLQ